MKTFNILSPEDFRKAMDELDSLFQESLGWQRDKAKQSAVNLLDFIEYSFGVNVANLSKIIRTAHALPTSSAGLEQCFSTARGRSCAILIAQSRVAQYFILLRNIEKESWAAHMMQNYIVQYCFNILFIVQQEKSSV